MKKLLFLLMLTVPVFGDIAVTPGVGKTVATQTNNSREYQGIVVADPGGISTMTVTSGGAALVISTGFPVGQSGIWTVQPGNTQNTTPWQTISTSTVITSTYSVNINVTNTPAVSQSGTWTVQPGNTQNTTAWQTVSTNTVVTSTQSHNGSANGANRLNVIPGIAQNAYGNNGSALTVGRDAAEIFLSSSGLQGVWSGPDYTLFSYSASSGTFTVNNSTQDVAGICGNANNKVLVYAIRTSCTETTAGVVPISIAKRSTAYTGSFSTITAAPQDANYGVVQSTVQYQFGQNSTNGTLVAYLDYGQIGCMAGGTATANDIYISPASWRMKPIVLRGTSQCVGINYQGTALSGGKFTAAFEWMEVSGP